MTSGDKFGYFKDVLGRTEGAVGQAYDAWEAARSRFVSGDIDFVDYMAAFRLYMATTHEANMLRMSFIEADCYLDFGDTLQARQKIDDKAQRLTARYWRNRSGAKTWLE